VVGEIIATLSLGVDGVALEETVSAVVLKFPAASVAVTVIWLDPLSSVTPAALQELVPAATPWAPRSVAQVTCVTPTLSEALPLTVMLVLVVLKVDDEVGEVMLIVGAVVSGVCGRVTVSTALAELPA